MKDKPKSSARRRDEKAEPAKPKTPPRKGREGNINGWRAPRVVVDEVKELSDGSTNEREVDDAIRKHAVDKHGGVNRG